MLKKNCTGTKDKTGMKFGMLTVLKHIGTDIRVGKRVYYVSMWECKCDCGRIIEKSIIQLLHSKIRKVTCGSRKCLKNYLQSKK